MAKRIRARKSVDATVLKTLRNLWPLFLVLLRRFTEKFDVPNDPEEIIIDFREKQGSRYVLVLKALKKLTKRYRKDE